MSDKRSLYEVVIGMEVHVQLLTKTKIFCTCANEAGVDQPNTNICQICTGHPGTLPMLNQEVITAGIKAGLATNSQITPITKFARKHYFYPDLPKGYQITQSDKPICEHGQVTIRLEDGSKKNIRLMRIHMEEDAGKNIHAPFSNASFVDLNRAGTPLLEMVTQPDLSSSYEVREYLKILRLTVQYLGICSGNMEDGAFRADTNISVRKKGQKEYGTKCELKNINSFKFISDAIEYEIDRQIDLLESGEKVKQETRLWDSKAHKTITMRSKEEAADYRYFNDPDLPIIEISSEQVNSIKNLLPELPNNKFERFVTENKLTPYEAEILISDLELANFYDEAYKITKSTSLINWILRDVLGFLKDNKLSLSGSKINVSNLAKLMQLIDNKTINNKAAQEIFEIMATSGKNPEDLVKELGLQQIGSIEDLEPIIKKIVEDNPKVAADYKSGKDKLFGFFVGQAMQQTKGKADPKIINDLLHKYLK